MKHQIKMVYESRLANQNKTEADILMATFTFATYFNCTMGVHWLIQFFSMMMTYMGFSKDI